MMNVAYQSSYLFRSSYTSIFLGIFERNEQHNNLLLASFGAINQPDPHAEWNLLAENVTVLVKGILMNLGSGYSHSKGSEVYMGKCVAAQPSKQTV